MGLVDWGLKIQDKVDAQKEGRDLSGYQQLLAQKHLEQQDALGKEVDWTGLPGYEGVQAAFEEKKRGQVGIEPITTPTGHGYTQGKRAEGAKYGGTNLAKKGAEEGYKKQKTAMEAETDPVVMGKTGFEISSVRSRKETTFRKIQEKRQMGEPITANEAAWERQYIGIKTKTAPETPHEIKAVRDMAKDMARTAMVGEVDMDGNEIDVKKYQPTEQAIQDNLPDAVSMLYPNGEANEIIEKTDFSITLPDSVTSVSQARQFLATVFETPEEIDQWLLENVEAE